MFFTKDFTIVTNIEKTVVITVIGNDVTYSQFVNKKVQDRNKLITDAEKKIKKD